MDYYYLYRKYKRKYLNLKNANLVGGEKTEPIPSCTGEPHNKKTNLPPFNANQCKNNSNTGNDGKEYLSVPDANGNYKWKRIKSMEDAKSAFEYYGQYPNIKPNYNVIPTVKKLEKVKKELAENNIFLLEIGWEKVWDYVDYAWDDAMEFLDNNESIKKLKKKSKSRNIGSYYYLLDTVSFILYSNYTLFWSSIDGKLPFQFNILERDKDAVIKIFKKYFPKEFSWSGNKKDAIMIRINDKLIS